MATGHLGNPQLGSINKANQCINIKKNWTCADGTLNKNIIGWCSAFDASKNGFGCFGSQRQKKQNTKLPREMKAINKIAKKNIIFFVLMPLYRSATRVTTNNSDDKVINFLLWSRFFLFCQCKFIAFCSISSVISQTYLESIPRRISFDAFYRTIFTFFFWSLCK